MKANPANSNLVEITTNRQKNRGTRQFFDQKHKVHYISYANGYVRREQRFSNGVRQQCLINYRKKTGLTQWGTIATEFLLIDNETDRIARIDYISRNYKGYTGYRRSNLI